MKKNYLIIALLFSSIIFGQTTFSVPNGLWSNAVNWSNGLPNPTSTSDVTLDANVNLDSNQTIGGFLRSGTRTVSGTGTLTSAGTFTGALLCVDTNFTFNSNLVLNGTNANTIKSLQVNNDVGSTTARQLTLGPLSVLTLTTPASVVTGPSSKVVFQGKIQGAAALFFNGVAEFDELSDNTGFNGEMVFNTSTANVIANTTGTAAFLKVNQKIQVNATGGSLTLNGANSCNGYLSVGGTNAFTMHINANQQSFGSIIVGNGPLTIKVAPAVTNLSFANSSGIAWGSGTIAITGYQSGEIRFGTTSTALTTAQLSRITADGAATGLPLALDSNGYLVLGDTFSYFNNTTTDGKWSTAGNWAALLLPTQNVQLSANVNLDSNFSITGMVRNGNNILSGTGTLTSAGTVSDGVALLSNGTNFTFNGNLVINNTFTTKSLQVNNNTASNRQLTLGSSSVLTLTTPAVVITGVNSKVVFQGKIQGANALSFGSGSAAGVAEFDTASDNRNFTGEMVFNANASTVIANTIGAGAFLRAGSRVQVNNTGCSLTLNGANSYNGNLSVGATNAFALNINANQPSFGNIINANGTLTINVAAAVTNLSFASSAANSWGTGTIAFTGYQSGEIRFGTNSSALTATQLSRITADGTASGKALALDSDGYLVVVVAPTITQLTSNGSTAITQGCTGSSLVITGSGFDGATAVRVGTTNVASFVVNNSTSITATLPSAAVSGVVSVINAAGSASSSGSFAVNAFPTAGLTSNDADNAFCAGTSVTFTATGGTNYNFRVAGSTVQNSATATYTTTALTNGQVVTVIVTNASGCFATSSGITNTVNALPTAGLTSNDADNTFCAGTSVVFTATGGTNYNFRVAGSTVQNSATASYTTTALTNGQAVTVIVTNASGCVVTSSGIANTVNALPTAGLTSNDADNTFCAGTSVTFTATGGTNYNFRVAGSTVQNSATATYTTTALTNGQVVDVIVTNASGCVATSSGITNTVNPNTTTDSVTQSQVGGTYTWPANGVTYSSSAVVTVVSGCNTATLNLTITPITETIWNGSSWNYGAPTATLDAIINGTYSTTTNGVISAKNLTVNSGSTLTVSSSAGVTVAGAVTNNGTINVANNANFVQNTGSTYAGSGPFNVSRASNSLFRLDYTLWSSPVTSPATLLSFSPLTSAKTPIRFFTYSAAANNFVVAAPETDTFTAGRGYLIRMPNENPNALGVTSGYYLGNAAITYNGSFSGTPNNGTITAVASATANSVHGVGNPYPSTISANDFIIANGDAGTLYFWREKNATAGTAYSTYTRAGGTAAINSGGITPNGTIQVGQGFIFKAGTTGPIVFTNAMRTNSSSTTFFKTKKETEKSRVWLSVSNDKGGINQALVAYMDGATKGFDTGIDGKYISDLKVALNSVVDNEDYVIQGRPAFDAADEVALSFKTDVAGSYTIELDKFDGLFEKGQAVYLLDRMTGVETDLKAGSYTFTATAAADMTRFVVKYQKTLKVDAPAFNESSVKVFKNNGSIMVSSTAKAIKSVQVYDVQGRLVAQLNNVKSNTARINNVKVANQMLVVKVSTEDNLVVSKKILN